MAAVATSIAATDLALYRSLRSRAVHPGTVRAARGLSYLGEHAAVWLVGGAAGGFLNGSRRAEWLRATASVAGAHALNVAVNAWSGVSDRC